MVVTRDDLIRMRRAVERSLVPGVTFKKWKSYRQHLLWCCQQEGVKPSNDLYERCIAWMREVPNNED